jgi:hypothetical protein
MVRAASVLGLVKRHFPFSSTRFNPVPLLESASVLSLNMFTSLHDARSAQRTRNTPLKDANTCAVGAMRSHAECNSRQASINHLLTDDVCSGWLARWRRDKLSLSAVEGPACRWTSSQCSHRVLTRCLTQSRKREHLRMLFNLRDKAQHRCCFVFSFQHNGICGTYRESVNDACSTCLWRAGSVGQAADVSAVDHNRLPTPPTRDGGRSRPPSSPRASIPPR